MQVKLWFESVTLLHVNNFQTIEWPNAEDLGCPYVVISHSTGLAKSIQTRWIRLYVDLIVHVLKASGRHTDNVCRNKIARIRL